jgi:hypothetical protein
MVRYFRGKNGIVYAIDTTSSAVRVGKGLTQKDARDKMKTTLIPQTMPGCIALAIKWCKAQ